MHEGGRVSLCFGRVDGRVDSLQVAARRAKVDAEMGAAREGLVEWCGTRVMQTESTLIGVDHLGCTC